MSPQVMHHEGAEKNFEKAPFGSQSHRFDVSGVHPQSKMPGTFTEVFYDPKSMQPCVRRLGPGRYSLDHKRSLTPGPGWERALEVEQASKMPHLLYRETYERERQAKLNLGPGRYNSKDFIQDLSDRVFSSRGLIDLYEQRFTHKSKECERTPGPGTYGKGGVPQKALEESRERFSGKVPSFEWSRNINRSLPLVGSKVAAGTYEYKAEIDEKTRRQVGLRGPYDTFTGSRSAPIYNGHMAHPKPTKNRGPADYDSKTFLDNLNHRSIAHVGEFKKLDQYPAIPGERIFYTTPIQAPIEPTRPGPGYYEKTDGGGNVSSEKMPPFMQGAERFDERAKLLMMGPSVNNVGIGRYDVTKHEKYHSKKGYKSSFKSKVPILLEPTEDKIIKERLKPHVPSARKRPLKAPNKAMEDLILTKKMLNQ